MTRYIMSVVVLLSVGITTTVAQRVNQVVTKVIEESYRYRPGYEVAVEGEKADIYVETWTKPYIAVRVEVSARHQSRETAQRELEQIKVVAEQVKNKIYLRNTRLDKATRPTSVLQITYHITLPEECPVYVKNHFGAANISNLSNRLRIFGEYSQINIDNVQGLLDIRTRFGDITGEKIGGNVTINARRSDITLQDIGGSFAITAQYGVLRLTPNRQLRDLYISAEKSEVHLVETDHHFGYTLTTTHGQLSLPNNVPVVQLENTAEVKRVRIKPRQESYASITVNVTFGDLYLEREQEKKLQRLRD